MWYHYPWIQGTANNLHLYTGEFCLDFMTTSISKYTICVHYFVENLTWLADEITWHSFLVWPMHRVTHWSHSFREWIGVTPLIWINHINNHIYENPHRSSTDFLNMWHNLNVTSEYGYLGQIWSCRCPGVMNTRSSAAANLNQICMQMTCEESYVIKSKTLSRRAIPQKMK